MGGGPTSFCFAEESLRDMFAAALRNLAEGRPWDAAEGRAGLTGRGASASLQGCLARTPKNARKGWPHVLRLELAKPDNTGESKYIIALGAILSVLKLMGFLLKVMDFILKIDAVYLDNVEELASWVRKR